MCRKSRIIFTSLGVLAIAFIITAVTPAGFPFKAAASPQRHTIQHMNRVFYDFNGDIKKQDAGYLLQPMDRRHSSIEKYIPGFANRTSMEEDCSRDLHCGLLIYRSKTFDNHDTIFIPGTMATLPSDEQLTVKLIKSETIGNRRKLKIEVTGTDHTTVLLNFGNDTTLVAWSFGIDVKAVKPPFRFNTLYGLERKSIMFDMEFERVGLRSEPILEMVVAAHYVHHENIHTEDYKKFLEAFPNWAYLYHWVTDYKNYVF